MIVSMRSICGTVMVRRLLRFVALEDRPWGPPSPIPVWSEAIPAGGAAKGDGAGTIRYSVCEAGSRHWLTNLSPNMTANWVLASVHSRGGRFQS